MRWVALAVALGACTDLGGLSGAPATTTSGADASVDATAIADASAPSYDAPYDAPPVNAAYARTMHVTNPGAVALPSGHPVCFVLAGTDIADLVAVGKLRADLADLRVGGPLTDRPRTLDALPPSRTELCFRLERAIAAGATDDGYTLRYGDPNATSPTPAEPFVFDFFDGFDGAALGGTWTAVTPFGAPVVAGGVLKLPGGTPSGVTTLAGTDAVPGDASLELRVQITNPTSNPDPATGFYYWFGFQHTGDFTASEPWTIFVARGKGSVQAEHKTSSGTCAPGCEESPAASQGTSMGIYRVDRAGTAVTLTHPDGTTYAAQGTNGDMSVMIRNFLVTGDVLVDWVRARPLIVPEPTLALDAEKAVP